MNIDSQIKKSLPHLIEIRHWLHQHPEIRYKEVGTAALVQRELSELGIEARRFGPTGVVGLIRGHKPGRTVALRADMDALEIDEQTHLPYASTNGVMHACGHDGNTTILLGAARVLQAVRSSLCGNVKLIFQPAEEIGFGGKMMCDLGVMQRPRVDAVFALHAWPELNVGSIAVADSLAWAATDTVSLLVSGKGGHGAHPHNTIDPILIAARIIDGLQSIVSRTISPTDSGVVTIGSIHGGSSSNIIPESVMMQGTIRSVDARTRQHLFDSIRRIATNTARAHGGKCSIRVSEGYPATVNDQAMAGLVRKVGAELLGKKNVLPHPTSMGAEDFSYYLRHAPGCYLRLGVGQEGRPRHGLHNPNFDFNDKAIPVGVAMMSAIAMEFLARG